MWAQDRRIKLRIAGEVDFDYGNRLILNCGIKSRYNNQHNQQVAENTGQLVPLHTLRVPIAATKPATWDWETAAVPGRTRGTMNHSRLWANSRRPYGHLLRYASFGRTRISASPRKRPEAVAESRTSSRAEALESAKRNLSLEHLTSSGEVRNGEQVPRLQYLTIDVACSG
jgi:hypothetical protein